MNTRKKLTNMVLLALFAGLIFLMGQTPLGLIPLGFCNVTLLVIPVAVGTIYMGWKNGLILGATFAQLLGLDKDFVINHIITHRWKKHVKQGITNLYE